MSAVNSLTSALVSGSTTGTSASDGVAMGKEDFLKLLVAQLKNQDPLNPQDPTQFTAQLAQFSQLEQSIETNKNLSNLSGMSTDVEQMSALSLIGKPVTVAAENFDLNGTDAPPVLGYRLDSNAADVKVSVLNSSGVAVDTLEASSVAAGDHMIEWDGKDADGNALPAGHYFLSVMAQDNTGASQTATALVKTAVSGIDLDASGSQVVTANGTYAMNQVKRAGG